MRMRCSDFPGRARTRSNRTGFRSPGFLRVARGFTLVELLVVIAIISILVSLLVPALRNAQENTRAVSCRSGLRQLVVAAGLYARDSRGRLPDRTGWQYSRTSTADLNMGTYLGYPQGAEANPGLQFDSAFTCPASARFPGPGLWAYNRTFTLNEHMAGSCRWRPTSTSGYQGWYGENARATQLRAPEVWSRVSSPSAAGLFFDGLRFRTVSTPGGGEIGAPLPHTLYYNAFASRGYVQTSFRPRTYFPHRARATPGEVHMEDIWNVGFLDGHVRGLNRHESEPLAVNWQQNPFWGQ